jgi:glycosyltransferase involved in cell wall biosynthesis
MTPAEPQRRLVLIPSYDTGERVYQTVREARAFWSPVWVVVDGSTDGTAAGLQRLAAADPGLRVFVLPHNQGKGAAVLHGLQQAQAAGYTHALTMDADGQHPADLIPAFMQASAARPEVMVLGRPVFDASAPLLRVRGRKVSNAWTNLETLGAGVADSLYGFRVYPWRRWCGDAAPALDAPLRLRHRGRGAPGLARRQAGQRRCAGQIPAAPPADDAALRDDHLQRGALP